MSLDGSVALVTGAANGIGRAIALRLARDGADVGLADLDENGLSALAAEIHKLGRRSVICRTDVSDRDQVQSAVEVTADQLGGFHIMVNNAGIVHVESLLDIEPASAEKILRVNLLGVLWGIQSAARMFRLRGGGGKIINAGSGASHEGFALLGMYSATKFGIRALTQAAAKELATDGITVNAYCPGVVGTDMWTTIDERYAALTGAAPGTVFEKFVGSIALGRPQTGEEVAAFVSYLAGPDSDYMTGQSGIIDGGLIFR